ncbi:hypothetical protein BA6E_101352 [Bacteroidales bacterium 6E]|nr:hypothetical protein BA6E_101352 [Bacteroidales bacterium 6E]
MIYNIPNSNIASEISKFFTILFVIMSFITQSMGESGILFRLTPPDIMGGLAILFFVLSGHWFRIDKFWYILFFIFTLFVGGIFGLAFEKSLVEVIILLFLFLIFSVIIFHFNTLHGLRQLIFYIAIAAILASVFGLYDMAATIVGLPRIFPERAPGEVLSGFRNAGQAGAYFLVILSILIPIRSSQLISSFNINERRIINIAVVFSLIVFFLTGKIAAYIGFAVGLGGL